MTGPVTWSMIYPERLRAVRPPVRRVTTGPVMRRVRLAKLRDPSAGRSHAAGAWGTA